MAGTSHTLTGLQLTWVTVAGRNETVAVKVRSGDTAEKHHSTADILTSEKQVLLTVFSSIQRSISRSVIKTQQIEIQ